MRKAVFQSGVPGLDEDDAILSEDAEVRLQHFLKNENSDLLVAGERMSQSYQGIPDSIRTLLVWAIESIDGDSSLLHQATEGALHKLEAKFVPLMSESLSRSDCSPPEITAICTSPQWNGFFTAMAKRHPNSLLSNALKREKKLAEVAIHKASLENPDAFCDEFVNMLISSVSDRRKEEEFVSEIFFKRLSVLCAYDESVTKTALYLLAKLSRQAHDGLTRQFYQRVAQHVRKEAVSVIDDVQRVSSEKIILHGVGCLSPIDAARHVSRVMMMAYLTAVGAKFRSGLVDSILTVTMRTMGVGDFSTAVSMVAQIRMPRARTAASR